MNEIEIKKIFENAVGFNIDTKNRKRHFIYIKATFCKVCREFGSNKMGGKLSYERIGRAANIHHATVMHHCNNTFDIAYENNEVAFNLYNAFRIGKINREDILSGNGSYEYKEKYLELKEKYVKLKTRKEDSEIIKLINTVPDDKVESIMIKLKPLIKMTLNAKFYK
jgi:hypothetical protein